MDLKNIDVCGILPQRRPFIMVSRLVSYEPSGACTELDIREDNLFVDGGRLSYSGLIENMAQTCAAMVGYYNRYILGNDVSVGVIGAVRNAVIHSCPEAGQTISTEILVITEVFNVKMVKAVVTAADGTLLAEGTLKIAMTDVVAEAGKYSAEDTGVGI